ncbi:MAG: 2,3,4,5-tetrahydropyridine-2,6-dicarboxylate N-succinyltransferase [Gammaproteobacteria bacterium]|nr:2,3,4,5-tetrahydropyridine-2,6-dicarboxylate N-succinyltransferase [Gammaproteobacteria bacterium]
MTELQRLRGTIEAAFADRAALHPRQLPPALDAALEECLARLDQGELRVAEPRQGGWVVNEWLKKAVLLCFRVRENRLVDGGFAHFYDKIPLKYADATEAELRAGGVRIVPHALVRRGSYVAPDVVLMPSYVNIGAWIGAGTMVDTWATVGSCAQIGRNVHLSGGVGIGGVLEPAQAVPVVVEDGAFIGSRCIVVEGVRVGREAVLGAGVVLTASTPTDDVRGEQPVVTKGAVPARAVVIPGTQPKRFAAGEYGTPCALIIGTRGEATDLKVSLNAALREYELAV